MRWVTPRVCGVLVALHLLVAGSAAVVVGSGDGATAAGPDVLVAAAGRTEAVERYRFESTMSADMGALSIDEIVVLRGETEGGVSRVVVDFAEIFAAFGVQPPDGPVRLEAVSDASVSYVRAEGLDRLAAFGPVPPELAPLVDLGGRWGRVDGPAGLDPAAAAGPLGSTGVDQQSFFDLLRSATASGETSSGEVRGTPVTILRATVPLAEFGELPPEDQAMLDGLVIDVSVALDGDGVVRRGTFSFDLEQVAANLAAAAEAFDLGPLPSGRVEMAFDIFDLGDPGIDVALPDAPDAVDLTAAFAPFG